MARLPIFSFGHRSRCVYCGDPPTDREHVIPVSFQQPSRRKAFEACGPWTWACGDCNRALGNRGFDTFSRRCEWANWRLKKKLEPIHWTTREINRLDHGLRDYVRQQTAKRKWAFLRADYYQSREFYLNIENLSWEILKCGNRTDDSARFVMAYFSQTLDEIAELYRSRSWTKLF